MLRSRLLATIFTLLSPFCLAETGIDGVWLTAEGDGWIEIQSGENAGGFIAGSPDDPERLKPPRLDIHNPDPALRQRQLYGLKIIDDLQKSGTNKWKGKIYDPNAGKTYNCKITLVDADTLKLRGYLGISLLGRTEIWTRRK